MAPDTPKLDILVELQDQYSEVYPLSPTGARGWIRARRHHPKLDPEVFIEWDKDHWRYHGEQDGWTYEHHFRPVLDAEPFIPEQTPIDRSLDPGDAERCPGCGQAHEPEEENLEEQFLHTLLEAQEAAIEADGYFIITLAPRQHGDLVIYEPQIYTDALTETAREMIEAQLVHVAAQLFDTHMIDRVNGLEGRDGEPGR